MIFQLYNKAHNFVFYHTDKTKNAVIEIADNYQAAYSFIREWGLFQKREPVVIALFQEIVPPQLQDYFVFRVKSLNNIEKANRYHIAFLVHEVTHMMQKQTFFYRFNPCLFEGFAHYTAFKYLKSNWNEFNRFDNHDLENKYSIANVLKKYDLNPITSPENLENYSPWYIEDSIVNGFSENEKFLIKQGYQIIYGTGLYIFIFIETVFGDKTIHRFLESMLNIFTNDQYLNSFIKVFSMTPKEFENQFFLWMKL